MAEVQRDISLLQCMTSILWGFGSASVALYRILGIIHEGFNSPESTPILSLRFFSYIIETLKACVFETITASGSFQRGEECIGILRVTCIGDGQKGLGVFMIFNEFPKFTEMNGTLAH